MVAGKTYPGSGIGKRTDPGNDGGVHATVEEKMGSSRQLHYSCHDTLVNLIVLWLKEQNYRGRALLCVQLVT